MEVVNHECYVSLEVAKLLKEAGFNWKCEYAYMPSTEMGNVPFKHFHNRTNYNELQYEIYSAPTLDVAQRWLREVKGWILETHYFGEEFFGDDEVDIESDLLRKYPNKSFYMCYGYFENCMYIEEDGNTYEDSLEAGIKKCLELILKENK